MGQKTNGILSREKVGAKLIKIGTSCEQYN